METYTLVNLILFQQLEPYCYQKVTERYEVVSLEFPYKDLDAINMFIMLIYQRMGSCQILSTNWRRH